MEVGHRNRIILSERLKMSAEMVKPGSVVADVGCDHAHTSIWLVVNGIAPRTIAMDVRRGPLEKALGNIRLYGLEDKIERRLSDGLTNLETGEADTIIIAGMGGMLTVKILSEGLEKARSAKELILQPQSDIGLVRKFLRENGFFIVKEAMCRETGKFYNSIRAVPCLDIAGDRNLDETLGEVYDEFGELLLKSKNAILKELLLVLKHKNIRNLEQINLRKSELERSAEKKLMIEHEGMIIDKALSCYDA